MDLIPCLYIQILTLPSECHSTNTVFQIIYCPILDCSLVSMLLADRSDAQCGLLLLYPIFFED